MNMNEKLIESVLKICRPVFIYDNVLDMNYRLHKIFDFVLKLRVLDKNNKGIIKIDFDSNLIPEHLDFINYIENNSLVYSLEHKCHFKLNISKGSDCYFLSIERDLITKPKKVFVKEISNLAAMEFAKESPRRTKNMT